MKKLSRPQHTMFSQLTDTPQTIERLGRFQTACALQRRRLAVVSPDNRTVTLSPEWIRMEHLEKVINNVEGTPAEHTKAHKARETELDSLYKLFRDNE